MSNHSVGIRDAYTFYRKLNKHGVLLPEFLDIVTGYAKYIMDRLLDGDTVQLPERLGTLEFSGIKVKPRLDEDGNIKGLSPDWKKTNELWNRCPECKEKKEFVYFFNEHSQGIRYKLRWSKKRVFVSNKEFYTFKLSFTNRKRFKDSILNGSEYLVETFKT